MIIKAGADTYKIEYNLNSICDFEELTNIDISNMTARNLAGIKTIRALFFCGLRVNHPELTLEEAGNILGIYLKNGKTIKTLFNIINSELEKAGFITKVNEQNQFERREKKRNYHSKSNV